MIIAVDGTTASGKGTIAKALSLHYRLPHLDTGLLYRAVGRQCALEGRDPDCEADALAACTFDDHLLADPELRTEHSGNLASRVSIHPAVRAALFQRQRSFACQPAGAILDGRDIGTVIAPRADVKLFVTASLEARAMRRFLEMRRTKQAADLAEVTADLVRRDERDRNRRESPLRPAEDALLLDTSDLDAGAAINAAIAIVEGQLRR